jgi:ribosomal protein S2
MLISLDKAFRQLQSLVANNAKILFVGTTNDLIKQVIQDRALATENYYINKR